MTKERNGNIVKWIGLALAVAGWIYTLGMQGQKLQNNCENDDSAHPRIQENREEILTMKSDIAYIKKGIDEIRMEVRR